MTQKNLSNLVVSPNVWPGKEIRIQPGDLSKCALYGEHFWGLQKPSFEPILGAPITESSSGIIYFNNEIEKEDFEGFLRMLDIKSNKQDYAAFVCESSNPKDDKYLRQIRVVSKFGLKYMFNAIDDIEYKSFQKQTLTVEEALWEFIESEKKSWGTNFGDARLEGKFGGDGHYAREQLSFGFMLENSYYDIFRIWSRAWLVTK